METVKKTVHKYRSFASSLLEHIANDEKQSQKLTDEEQISCNR